MRVNRSLSLLHITRLAVMLAVISRCWLSVQRTQGGQLYYIMTLHNNIYKCFKEHFPCFVHTLNIEQLNNLVRVFSVCRVEQLNIRTISPSRRGRTLMSLVRNVSGLALCYFRWYRVSVDINRPAHHRSPSTSSSQRVKRRYGMRFLPLGLPALFCVPGKEVRLTEENPQSSRRFSRYGG